MYFLFNRAAWLEAPIYFLSLHIVRSACESFASGTKDFALIWKALSEFVFESYYRSLLQAYAFVLDRHLLVTGIALRTIIIVVPPLTFRTYQILPRTNSYFHCLYSYLDLL